MRSLSRIASARAAWSSSRHVRYQQGVAEVLVDQDLGMVEARGGPEPGQDLLAEVGQPVRGAGRRDLYPHQAHRGPRRWDRGPLVEGEDVVLGHQVAGGGRDRVLAGSGQFGFRGAVGLVPVGDRDDDRGFAVDHGRESPVAAGCLDRGAVGAFDLGDAGFDPVFRSEDGVDPCVHEGSLRRVRGRGPGKGFGDGFGPMPDQLRPGPAGAPLAPRRERRSRAARRYPSDRPDARGAGLPRRETGLFGERELVADGVDLCA